MLKHPIYLSICTVAALYFVVADAEGWSFWNSVAIRMPSAWGGGGGNYAAFHHK